MSALEREGERWLERARAFVPDGEPAWLAALRRRAAEDFAAQGLPSTRLEEWRYTNVARLAKPAFEPAGPPPGPPAMDALERLAAPLFACGLTVFVDGVHQPGASPLAAGADVRVESLVGLLRGAPERLEPHLGRLVDGKRHPFAALQTALFPDGAVLFVPRGVDLGEPLHVVFVSSADAPARASFPRLLIVAEEGSRVQVIQDHVSLGPAPSFTNAVSEIRIGAGARVDFVLLQREGHGGHTVSNTAVEVGRDGVYSGHTLTLGGAWVRNDLCARLAGEGAECTLDGLFVAGGDTLVDNHSEVDHALPRATSRQLYKGVLGGSARGVFRGRVVVRPDAQHTNAAQSNPNLLLGSGCEIDTKPQLEIFADDVKCSHGSTIGRIQEEPLFYLRSRGIDQARARDLLTRGFAAEVLGRVPVPGLGEGLDEPLAGALARASGREEGP